MKIILDAMGGDNAPEAAVLGALDAVKETGVFLIEIMPLMFIPAATGLMTSWGIIRAKLFAYLAIAVITTVLVMVVSGRVTQFFLRRGRGKEV